MRVMTFGTFDNLHPGHLDYFKQACRFGDELIVVIARDKNVLAIKNHQPQETEAQRLRKVKLALKTTGYQGKAVLGNLKNRWLILKKYRPEIICLGYDQEVDLTALKREITKFRLFCKIKRLKAYYPEKYKSSLFINKVK